MKTLSRLLKALSVAVVFFAAQAHAEADLLASSVKELRGVYTVTARAYVSSPRERVFDVLADYNNIRKLNDNIISSTVVRRTPGYAIVKTVMHDCVLFFCNDIVNLQQVLADRKRMFITSLTIPEESNLREGRIHWDLYNAKDGGTIVELEVDMAPDFWVPPLIGPAVIGMKLKKEARETLQKLDQLL